VRVIGIDVGGTNTDAALISDEGIVLAMVKTPTDHDDILCSVRTALEEIIASHKGPFPMELHLSTTLPTNAIVEGEGDPAAVVAIPGPGMNLLDYDFGFPVYSVKGYVDHRGRVASDIDPDEVLSAARQAWNDGARALAIVGKFSQRNNSLELAAKQVVEQAGLKFSQITLGHQLSGRHGFPRRIMTAYLNARVAGIQQEFAAVIERLMSENPIIAGVRILKADGGTMGLAESCVRPIETILSGPAASLTASLALSRRTEANTVVVDIGGTTTDIAVIAGGEPVCQRGGAVIGGFNTLVRALYTVSIGLGGDSEVRIHDSGVVLGPRRVGKAAALGGAEATPTDAAVALGLAELGQRDKAIAALKKKAAGAFASWESLAQAIIEAFVLRLCTAVDEVYRTLENVPVYTVSEILAPPDIRPRAVIGLGAPAGVFIPLAAEQLGLPWEILPYHASANGIGAAAARPTVSLSVHVDTEQEQMIIPELGLRKQIKQALFDQKQARRAAVEHTLAYAQGLGLEECSEIQIVEEEAFNVVRGFHTVGRIFNIRAQMRPGARRVR